MDLDTFVPVGGGTLRDAHQTASEPVATFTPTRTVHPDSIWNPLGGQFDQSRGTSLVPSPGDQGDAGTQQDDAGPDRPDTGDGYSHVATARMVRSALRPGR